MRHLLRAALARITMLRCFPPSPWIIVLSTLIWGLATHCAGALAQTPQPATTRYEYDANGNLTRIIDPLGRATVQRYNSAGRLTKAEHAGKLISDGTTNYVYSARGRSQSAASGRIIATYSRNELDQRVLKMVRVGMALVSGQYHVYSDDINFGLFPNRAQDSEPSGAEESACNGQDRSRTFLDCMARCIRAYDPLNNQSKLALTAIGGTFPKSWAGLPRGLGGASSMTTIPSVTAHALGGGGPETLGGVMRGVGRIASPMWIGYGVFLFGMEAYCTASCANSTCAH